MLWLALVALASARCPQPGEVRLSLLYPLDTAGASAVSAASFHGDTVVSGAAGTRGQRVRAQHGLCGWTVTAEVHRDSAAWSPAAGAAYSWARWGLRAGVEALAGAQGDTPLVAARLRLSRPDVRFTPYGMAESRQVLSGPLLGEGWTTAAELGLAYTFRDVVAIAAAGDVSGGAVGGHVGLSVKVR